MNNKLLCWFVLLAFVIETAALVLMSARLDKSYASINACVNDNQSLNKTLKNVLMTARF